MMMMTSASASGGDGGVAGSLSEVQRATGSSTAIAKFCSTEVRSAACSLSPTFPAGELVFFIPWRVVAENPARRSSTCRLTRTRRTVVMSPAAPDSFAVLFRFGPTLELGRSERPPMRPLWSYRVDGADSPDRKPR
jgi:hypothetical protein